MVHILPSSPIVHIGRIVHTVHIKHAQHDVRSLCHLFRFVHTQLDLAETLNVSCSIDRRGNRVGIGNGVGIDDGIDIGNGIVNGIGNGIGIGNGVVGNGSER